MEKAMLLNAIKILLSGPYKGITYHFNHKMMKGMYPTFLVYQFTKKCNSRCVMCNIWKENNEGELSIEQIRNIFKKRFFQQITGINLTGGEIFLRKDLEDVIKILCSLPKLKTIGVTTNGFTPEIIKKKLLKINDIIKYKPVNITVKVSIDGNEQVHNQIRGVKNGYAKTLETLKFIKNLNSNKINTGISCLIMNKNANDIDHINNELNEISDNISFTLPSISGGYFNNQENSDVLLDDNNHNVVIRFLRKISVTLPEHSFYNLMLINYLKYKKRMFMCLAGYKTIYMDNVGKIFPCAILSDNESDYCFGNSLDNKLEDLYFNSIGKNIRSKLKNCGTCSTCIFSCDLINNLREEFFEIAGFYAKNPYYGFKLFNKILKNKIRKDYIK